MIFLLLASMKLKNRKESENEKSSLTLIVMKMI